MSLGIDKLEKLKRYAKLLDSQFRIPGTNFKFGIDPILSLIPFLGSFSGLITGFGLILMSHAHGVSGRAKAMMTKNIIIDYLWGMIPIIGNIKDFLYKSNEKNISILEEHLIENKHQGSGTGILIKLLVFVFVFFVISIILFAYFLTLAIDFVISL